VSTIPPIRREVLVDADPATAFEVFTASLGRWWPLAELSVYGDGATVAFTGGHIVERSADGPGSGQLSMATRLATEDDISVSAGLLAVSVRPWHVVMHPAVSAT
jgi:hypothetical protein